MYLLFQWVKFLIKINNLLTVLNSAFNFLIYWSFCGRRTRNRTNRSQRFAMSTWSSAMRRSHGTHISKQDLDIGPNHLIKHPSKVPRGPNHLKRHPSKVLFMVPLYRIVRNIRSSYIEFQII